MKNFGFMQGRLVPDEQNRIQSFPWQNWKKEFLLAKKLRLNIMEWTIDYEKFSKNPINNIEGRKIIKKLSKINNLKINSITCDFFMQFPYFIHQNVQTFNKLKFLIDNASKLKIKFLVLPLVDNGSITNNYYEKKFIKQTIKLKKVLKKNNMSIIFESDYGPRRLNKFIKKFPKNIFGINYDTGNSAGLKINIKDEFLYFDRVLNIHLKDKKNNISVDLGKGTAQFKELFNFCKKTNYRGNFILQTARNRNNLGIMKKNINFIKKYL